MEDIVIYVVRVVDVDCKGCKVLAFDVRNIIYENV